jgi:hypothetical protein
MSFFYKTLPKNIFFKRFNYLKQLKIWRSHFVDNDHILIKVANERTIMELDITDQNTRNQLPSQVAFFILYRISSGEILAVSENSRKGTKNIFEKRNNFNRTPSYKMSIREL